jgi:hypothetical protein
VSWCCVCRYMRDKTTPRPQRAGDLRIAYVSRQQVGGGALRYGYVLPHHLPCFASQPPQRHRETDSPCAPARYTHRAHTFMIPSLMYVPPPVLPPSCGRSTCRTSWATPTRWAWTAWPSTSRPRATPTTPPSRCSRCARRGGADQTLGGILCTCQECVFSCAHVQCRMLWCVD